MASSAVAAATSDSDIEAVRRFNRFYTQRIGVLEEGLLHSGFTLAEARILFELAHDDGLTASRIGRNLGLDQGYLSRMLTRFEASGLIERQALPADRRQSQLSLTAAGREAFAPLNSASQAQIAQLLAGLDPQQRETLRRSMYRIEGLLSDGPGTPASGPVALRPHRIGDIGWIVHRQARLYGTEYGWNQDFEVMLGEIGCAFLRDFDPSGEACWIAERDSEILGAVFLVRAAPDTGQLRMLYVESAARGLGIGGQLVAACIDRARQVGYRRLTLWTNDILGSARKIYQAAGFRLVREERHHSFGVDLVGQFWDLDLTAAPGD